MIGDYLEQSVLWKKWTGGGDYSGRTYDNPVEIPARVVETARMVGGSSSGGQETRATNDVSVTADVRVGDLVDWRPDEPGENYDEVQARSSLVDLFGELEGYVLHFEAV